jgi:hypothetical protein
MAGEKADRIQSLNQSETEVLHYIFRDPNFKVIDVARELYRGEGGIRTNLTAIFKKLEVPDDVDNKREWVVREYSEAYQYVFKREEWEVEQAAQRVAGEPEIFINPPDPILVEPAEPLKQPEASQPTPQPVVTRTQSGPSCGEAISLVLGILLLTVIFFLVGVQLEHSFSGFLGYYLGVTPRDHESQPPGTVLFVDSFDSDQLSPEWVILGDQPIVADGAVSNDGYLGLSVGDDSWVNYMIFANITVKGCTDENKRSKIGVRYNGMFFLSAYEWSSCDYLTDTVLAPVITIQGNHYTVVLDGQEVVSSDFNNDIPESGGIFIEFYGSALNNILVVALP